MRVLTELCCIIPIVMGVSAFSIHILIRKKELRTTNELAKARNTTNFLFFLIAYNLFDYLSLILESVAEGQTLGWICTFGNIMGMALCYGVITMERQCICKKTDLWIGKVFAVIAVILLWTDTVYVLDVPEAVFHSQSIYAAAVITLNITPVAIMVYFWIKHFKSTFSEKDIKGYLAMNNLLCLVFCIWSTARLVDLRLGKNFLMDDKKIYFLFWVAMNVLNLVFLWRSCDTMDGERQVAETFEEKMGHISQKYKLSERETEIARLIFKGKNNSEIAGMLYLSPNTIKAHTSSLYKKLGVSNRIQAMQLIGGEKFR